MPNIIKIRQGFLKLQLKMSGMFFETHCMYTFADKKVKCWSYL